MGKGEDVERAAREQEYAALENELHVELASDADVPEAVDEVADE